MRALIGAAGFTTSLLRAQDWGRPHRYDRDGCRLGIASRTSSNRERNRVELADRGGLRAGGSHHAAPAGATLTFRLRARARPAFGVYATDRAPPHGISGSAAVDAQATHHVGRPGTARRRLDRA